MQNKNEGSRKILLQPTLKNSFSEPPALPPPPEAGFFSPAPASATGDKPKTESRDQSTY
jgi:hypothetical protein